MVKQGRYSGGRTVKVSSLVVGNQIRDNRKRDRILVVESLGSPVFAKGLYEPEHHVFLDVNSFVELVTGG